MRFWFGQNTIAKVFKNRRLRWNTIYLLATTAIAVVVAFLVNWAVGIILLLLGIIGLVMSLSQLQHLAGETEQYLSDLTYEVQNSQQEALLEMPIGIIIMNSKDVVRWANPYMVKYFGDDIVVGDKLENSVPELAKIVEDHRDDSQPAVVTWRDRQFEFRYQKRFNNIYLMDITKYEEINQRYINERLFLGNIYLDNYVELTQGMSDSDVSNLHNYVTSELSDWADKFNLLLKVIDDDNYLLLGHEIDLHKLEERKFKILDTIRENTSKMNSPVTLSVGISYGQTDFIKLADTAQRNLDLALGRGGDQVVVRAEDEQARFFGGKTNPMEKRTRVRARVMSHAFQELMNQADQIFVVGHTNPDMDSMGACLGIRRIAEMNDKKCWIVLDQERLHSDVAKLLFQFKDYQSIEDCIISPEEALDKATDKSLLVMVDHSKVSLSMAPKLYERLTNRTVIIDHHRRGEEFPENPLLVYIEPYASSTCELITEMFEYQPREGKGLNKIEATAMLTGIEVDTKNFIQNSGTRTFDAASYLRSAGADGQLIQYFMKENVDDFMERNHLIANTKFVDDKIALCVGPDDKIYDIVTAAQAADMLLQVEGVSASFVITRRSSDTIGISARSVGDYNVQIIMEKMGGGGHLGNAATQIKGHSIDEVKQQLLDILQSKDDTEETEE
ncbi:MAG: DHH family phosphoesterase [Candidatus Limosilactobacillus intestinavium]|jgi:c-di-AMP phosphodiesterase-like protein